MKLTVTYNFLPKLRSLRASLVMDHFGIGFETGKRVIAERLEVPIEPGDVVLFTGASGSGKSSLLRAAAEELRVDSGELRDDAIEAENDTLNSQPSTLNSLNSQHSILHSVIILDDLALPNDILVEAIELPFPETLALLSSCGLGEAQLLLRTPKELSDGQRYRFRLALALSRQPRWIIADEFTATLDRVLAKVIAFNIRRLANRTGAGFLLATTHEDVAGDLAPDVRVRCRLDGEVHVDSQKKRRKAESGKRRHVERDIFRLSAFRSPLCKRRPIRMPDTRPSTISFSSELSITTGTKSDWPYFARWHYRSHNIGAVKRVTLLWHGEEPVGICVFTSPPVSLAPRNRFFGISGKWSRTQIRAMNEQLVTLSRVVLHPTYRGAGVATRFIRRSCETSRWPWIETLTQMGHINPFFEKAGFQRVGVTQGRDRSRQRHSDIYGGRKHAGRGLVTHETNTKSRYAQPVYYVFDNRHHAARNRAQ